MKSTPRARAIALTISVLALGAACSHATRSIETDPGALAAVHADVRVVSGETTLVAHGPGYELVALTKGEIARVQPELDRDAAMFKRVFPADSLASIVVTVRHATPPGKPYVAPPRTPAEIRAPVVDVVLPDPNAKDDERRRDGFFARSEVLPAERAWMSAHATEVTQKPGPRAAAKGEAEDARVPAWADEVITSLTGDSVVDRVTTQLAAHPDALIPLPQFLTMERPAFAGPPAGQRGGEGRPSGGSGRGGMGGGIGGGMGGRGGMGGMRGGMGRGGSGGERSRSEGGRESMPLMGGALFGAQSVAFGRYLVSRDGYDFIGALVDAQLTNAPVDSVLEKRATLTVAQMDADFRRWLVDRAATVSR